MIILIEESKMEVFYYRVILLVVINVACYGLHKVLGVALFFMSNNHNAWFVTQQGHSPSGTL